MKTELTKRIFTACMAVLILTFGLLMYVVNSYLAQRNMNEMKHDAKLAAAVVEEQGWEFLRNIHNHDTNRITVIDKDGRVLYDSARPASEIRENYSDREEVMEAMKAGEGDSERYSETLLKKEAYYAVRTKDGKIVRVSMMLDTVWKLLYSFLTPLVIIILLMTLLSITLASRLSAKIMRPINRLDVENPDDRDVYPEMKPFILRMIAQNQQIHSQMHELEEEHKKQDAMRREFTANVSHELKTPLTSISGFAEIIRDGFVKEKDIPHFADNIYKESQRLLDLVNDIMGLTRLEDGSDEMHVRSDVDLQGMCNEVRERLLLNAEKKHVAITCEGEPVHVSGVRKVLGEIIYNICDNAIKYNRDGGYVKMTTGKRGDEVFVLVKDNGIGIPEEEQSRVFERFYRVNKSHSKEVGGTGLGLSIVKHGVALHGGRITIHSSVDQGTEIGIWLPATEKMEQDISGMQEKA